LNAGICRAESPEGPFTPELAMRAVPVNEELIGLQLKGINLLAAIEQGLDQFHGHKVDEAFPRLAGVRFTVLPHNKLGSRVKNPEILTHGCKWKAVDPAKHYHILTSRSLADGGFNYEALTDPVTRVGTGVGVTDGFYFYAQSVCTLRDPYRTEKPALTKDYNEREGQRVIRLPSKRTGKNNRTITAKY
jgi:5'-nucleotidase/UDP-sugar diphosphatase